MCVLSFLCSVVVRVAVCRWKMKKLVVFVLCFFFALATIVCGEEPSDDGLEECSIETGYWYGAKACLFFSFKDIVLIDFGCVFVFFNVLSVCC